jgi:hypothetical protein
MLRKYLTSLFFFFLFIGTFHLPGDCLHWWDADYACYCAEPQKLIVPIPQALPALLEETHDLALMSEEELESSAIHQYFKVARAVRKLPFASCHLCIPGVAGPNEWCIVVRVNVASLSIWGLDNETGIERIKKTVELALTGEHRRFIVRIQPLCTQCAEQTSGQPTPAQRQTEPK